MYNCNSVIKSNIPDYCGDCHTIQFYLVTYFVHCIYDTYNAAAAAAVLIIIIVISGNPDYSNVDSVSLKFIRHKLKVPHRHHACNLRPINIS